MDACIPLFPNPYNLNNSNPRTHYINPKLNRPMLFLKNLTLSCTNQETIDQMHIVKAKKKSHKSTYTHKNNKKKMGITTI